MEDKAKREKEDLKQKLHLEKVKQERLKKEKEKRDQEESKRLKQLRLEHKEQERTAWDAKEKQYQKEIEQLRLKHKEWEQTEIEEDNKIGIVSDIKKHCPFVLVYNIGKSFESDLHMSVFDRDNPTFVHGIVDTMLQRIGVFDCDNPTYIRGIVGTILQQIGVFDRDNPTYVCGIVGTILQQIGVFDQDNPAAPPKRTGNIFPLFDLWKRTGNRASVLLLSDFAANLFTGPVPLTSDLEPDRCDYFTIPTFAGKFLQSLLITGNLFVFPFIYFYYSRRIYYYSKYFAFHGKFI